MKRSIIFLTIMSLTTLNGLAMTRDFGNQEDNVQCAKLTNDEKIELIKYRQENLFGTEKDVNRTHAECDIQKGCDDLGRTFIYKDEECDKVTKLTPFAKPLWRHTSLK